VFVGREAELAGVDDLLGGLQAGRGGGLVVVGEPGVGKTRLLVEAGKLASVCGIRAARTNCLPLTTVLPFDPALDLLRSIGAPVAAPSPGDPPSELFGLLIDRLEQASMPGPLLLCMDDLQWSDAATIDLVHYCLARLRDLPLGFLLAARPDRASNTVIRRLQRDDLVRRLELRGLSASDTRTLSATVLGRDDFGDDLVSVLLERTGGNPFLCVELLRALSSSEHVGESASEGTAASITAMVPRTVQDAIAERTDRLSAATRTAIEWAAVMPETFTIEELAAVSGVGLRQTQEELTDEAFLVLGPDGRCRFVHSIIHDAVYRRLPEAERVRRHGVVADTLRAMPVESAAPQLERARRFREAAAAYLELADRSLNRGQGEDAVRFYERSDALAEVGGDQPARRRAQAGRALALVYAGTAEEARRAAAALRSELRSAGEPKELLRFLSKFANTLMMVHDAADIESTLEALQEAEPLIDRVDDVARAETLATRAWLSLRTGDVSRALADAEQAAALARQAGDARLSAGVLNALGLAVGLKRGAREGIAVLEEALACAITADVPAQAARACLNLSFLAESVGDVEAVERYCRRGLEFRGVPPSLEALLHSNLGELPPDDLETSLAHVLTAMRIAERAGPLTRARTACTLAYVRLWRGELALARGLLEEHGLVPGNEHDIRALEVWGLLLEAEGKPEEGLVIFQRGTTEVDDPISLWCAAGAARTAVAVGQLSVAQDMLVSLDRMVGRWPVGEWIREEARGWVAASEHRNDQAIDHFEAAAARSSRAWDAARLRFEAARLGNERGEMLAAIEVLEQIGAARAADRARAVARRLGMRPGRPKRRAGVLSTREQEVVQLVAAGKTNVEIAANLYLSPRTVERHIGNILSKLGYRSRVQIAAEAAAGHLPGMVA
jgi:DNA-binding CsgD family transcriptional regulator